MAETIGSGGFWGAIGAIVAAALMLVGVLRSARLTNRTKEASDKKESDSRKAEAALVAEQAERKRISDDRQAIVVDLWKRIANLEENSKLLYERDKTMTEWFERRLSEKETQITALSERLTDVQVDLAQVRVAYTAATEQNRQLREQVDTLTAERTTLQQETARLKARVSELERRQGQSPDHLAKGKP